MLGPKIDNRMVIILMKVGPVINLGLDRGPHSGSLIGAMSS